MYYIWKEWKENLKSKGLWLSFSIIIIISIGILLKSSTLSFEQGFYVLLLNLFDALIYFIPILCLFLGAFSIFQEKEHKTLIMLLTRRDSFVSFLFKKSLAIHSVTVSPILVWFFIYLVPAKFYFSIDFKSYLAFLLSLLCIILVFTQIGVMVGSISRSRMQIVGFSITIWFYFFFLHDFILLSYLSDVTYENVKLFSSAYFINPLQTARLNLESAIGVFSFGHMSKLLQSFMWMKPVVFLVSNLVFWFGSSLLFAIIFHRKEGSE
ncbi:ABC transporter permease [Cytobacillus sp. FJAT-54145]|uniref:ABC transporter permease n=1 Tax=Cytobacillus spartinae TaxID=3299023 RepID=A0ABW6KCM6_9BACI